MTLQKRPSKFFLRETKNMLKAFEKKEKTKEETKPVRKDSHETFKVLKK